MVQVKFDGAEAESAISGLDPLQTGYVAELVTWGIGWTVTVMIAGIPLQDPFRDTGVTIYCTVPAAEWLGLIRV